MEQKNKKNKLFEDKSFNYFRQEKKSKIYFNLKKKSKCLFLITFFNFLKNILQILSTKLNFYFK